MMPLYLINSIAYLGAAVVILFALHRIGHVYRWIFILPFLTCVYYGGIYLAVITGGLPEHEIADWTRTVSAILPIQLAAITLFVVRLLLAVPNGHR